MARYFVGGALNANWDEATAGVTNWGTASNTRDLASVPGSADDVFFDGSAFGNAPATLSANITIKSLDCTGYTNTLTHNAAVTLTVSGNGVTFKLVSGMTYSLGSSNSSAVTFTGTSGTTNITSGTKTVGNFTFNGAGGTWSLVDNMTAGGGTTITLTAGTFNANNNDISVGGFSSTNSNTRTLTMGSGTWTLTSNGTVWTTANSSGLTLNANASTLRSTYSGATACTLTMNGVPVNHLKLTAGTYTVTLTSVMCNDLDFTGFTGTWGSSSNSITISGSLTMVSGMTVSIAAASITFNATSGIKTITSATKTFTSSVSIVFNGVGGTWQLADGFSTGSGITLTNGTFDANNQTVAMLSFTSSNSNTRVVTLGTGLWTITATTAITVWDTSTTTGLTINVNASSVLKCTGVSGTAQTINMGSKAIGKLWLSAGTRTYTLTGVSCVDLDFTGFTGTWGSGSNAISIAGSLLMVSGMTNSNTAALTFTATSGTKTITSATKTFAANFTFNGAGGTFQLADTFSTTGTWTLTAGTLDANTKSLTIASFSSSNSNTRSILFSTGTWTVTGTGTVWNTTTETGLTATVSTATVDCTDNSASALTVIMGGAVPQATLKRSAGSGIFTTTNCSVNDLTFTSGYTGVWGGSTTLTIAGTTTLVTQQGTPTYSGTLTFTATSSKNITTVTKSLVCGFEFNGVSGTWVLQDALTTTGTATLTNGTWNTNAKAVSAGSFSSSNANTRVLTLTSTTLTITGTGTVWDTTTTTGLTFTTTSSVVEVNASSQTISPGGKAFATFNFNNATPNATVTSNFTATTCTITGSGTVTMSGASNWDVTTLTANTSTLQWTGGSTATVTSHGQSFYRVVIAKTAATSMQLVDAIIATSTSSITLTSGTFDANNQNVTTPAFDSSNRNTRSILFGSGTWTLTGTGIVWDTLDTTNLTTTPSTSVIKINDTSSTDKVFSGGGIEVYDLWFTGAGTGAFIVRGGNKFHDFKCDTPPHTIKFQPGSMQRVTTFTVSGTVGNLMTCKSETDGEAWDLFLIGGGTVTRDYLSLQDSRAS